MVRVSWRRTLAGLARKFAPGGARRRAVACGRFRPGLEPLEHRLLLTTIRWTNPNGGSWQTTANWDLQRVPGPGDDVVIDPAGGTGTVTYLDAGTTEIQSLYSALPVRFSGDTLWVHGTVRADNTFQVNAGTLRGATIVAGTTVQVIGGVSNLRDVTLEGSLLVPTGQVVMQGAWSNRGAITVSGGTLVLSDSFPASAIGRLSHTAGNVQVSGVLDNAGNHLTLDDRTGSWQLTGTIRGGTVTATGVDRLLTRSFSTLDGVVYNGTLDVNNSLLTVKNGLTLNGTLLADAPGPGAGVNFQGSQTLGGNGTLVGSSSFPIDFEAAGGTVTLAPTITVRGGTATLGNVINQGTIDASAATANITLSGTWHNEGVITLGQGTVNLSGTFAAADLGDFRRSGGTVNLSGTVNNANRNLTLNAATGSWQLAGGTIRGGTVMATGGAALNLTSRGGTLDGVSLFADVQVPANTFLGFAGTWSNHGTLTVSGGILNLGGTFSPAAVGTLHRTGGTVNITGTLDNTGNTLVLNAATGSWRLANGGTIRGGFVVLVDGVQLQSSGGINHLAGVVVNGYLAVTDGNLEIDGGLTLNGTLAVGSGAFPARVRFAGTQTLAGAATVLLGAWPSNGLDDPTGTVTYAPTVLVRGGGGELSDFVNQGMIEVSTPDANLTLGADGGSWSNRGTLALTAGTLNLGSPSNTFTVAALGSFTRTGGTVNLAGTLSNMGQTLTLNAATGSWLLAGGRITGGSLATAGGAALIPTSNKGTLSGVTLDTDITVGPNTGLALAGNWVNHGVLSVMGGRLDLGGSMTVATLGQIQQGSGTVSLTGTVNNTGTTLTLSDTTGRWILNGGTIQGGTVVTDGNARLVASYLDGQLDGVTLTGALDLTAGRISVTHGLTCNGTIAVGGANSFGQLSFNGTQRLDGTCTVTFGNHPSDLLGAFDGTVTLGPGTTVEGGTGLVNSFVNKGTIHVATPGANVALGGVNWRNAGLLALSSGTLNLGGTFAAADLGAWQRRGGSVNLVGTMNNTGGAFVLDQAVGSWQLDGGQINGGSVATAGGAALLFSARGGKLNGVALNTDVQLTGNSLLTLSGAWSNRGTLTLAGGTLDLGGTFTRDALGDFRRTGGTVNLTGTLSNAGRILTLNAGTGSWRLQEGTIDGGTVLLEDGTTLTTAPGTSNRLNAVTLDGYLEVSNNSYLTVTNGLTLNGVLVIGNDSTYGHVTLSGAQTVGGAGFIRLGSASANSLSGSVAGVVFGPNITIQGGAGSLENFVNQGTIDVSQVGADVSLGGSWRNNGVLSLTSGTLNLGGTFSPAALGTFRRNGGTVNLTGTLDNTGQTFTLNAATGSWRLAGGRIEGGTVATSSGAALVATRQGGTLNGLALNADVTIGPNSQLTLSGSWVNHGVLSLTGGTLNLGGTFRRAALGTVRRTGGTVNITGTLDNTGTELVLDDTTGSWTLNGTIQGGTVATTGSARLLSGSSEGQLRGVTFNGDLNVTAPNWTITDSLTLNGTLTLGDSTTATGLSFNGTQTLAGTGTVVFAASPNVNILQAMAGMVTIAHGITVRGGFGRLTNFINQGGIELTGATSRLQLAGASWRNDGMITLTAGTLILAGTVATGALGDLRRLGGTVTLAGTLINTGTTLALDDRTGSWELAGGTINGGSVTATAGASLLATNQGGTLNGVTLHTTVAVGSGQQLSLTGAWSNQGTLILAGGQLNLGGNFTMATLGHFQWTTGTFHLTGTLTNTGNTLDLDQIAGSFVLGNGTIIGGTVNVRGATHLTGGMNSGRLDGVTVNGTIDVVAGLVITNNLVLNGTLTSGLDAGRGGGGVSFQGGPQTLSGTARIVFGPSGGTLQGVDAAVTLAPSVTVMAQSADLINVRNEGVIELTNFQGTLSLEGNSWRNGGQVVLTAGTLNLGGVFTVAALGNIRRAGGTVNLTGTLENSGGVLTLNAATGPWQLAGGTIHGGTVTAQDGTSLAATARGGTLDGVVLNTDVMVPGSARLSLAGAWSNHGTLTLGNGVLDLGGTFTVAALGTLRRQAGTVNLTGTLSNAGTTLTLDDTTGDWFLSGGTIDGGTVTLAGGARLLARGFPVGRMNGVTFNGNLDRNGQSFVVTNGLTLNGTLTLGPYGVLLFQGTQTLGGRAAVIFQGGAGGCGLGVVTDGATLTLEADVSVRGGNGAVGFGTLWSPGSNIGLVIKGTISADVTGQAITLAAASIQNQGLFEARNGGMLSLQRRDTTGGGITNEGTLFVDVGSSVTANTPYVQTGGATYLNGGTLTAPLVDLRGGLLGGSGVIAGSVRNEAVLAVGFDGVPGSLAIRGDYTQTADGTLAMKIGGTDQGTGYDSLSVSGTAVLDGTLEVSVLDGFFARPGDTFTLVTFGQRQGEFATVNGLHPRRQHVVFDPAYDDASFTLFARPRRHRGTDADE